MLDFGNAIYLFCYFVTICLYVAMGTYMLARHENPIHTQGELKAKKRMTRCVGLYVLNLVVQNLVYMPSILIYGYDVQGKFGYDLCFLVTILLNTPMLFVVMQAMVQRKVNTLLWVSGVALPFLVLIAWFVIAPQDSAYARIPVYLGAVAVVACLAFLVIRYYRAYLRYVERMKAEYSETAGREIGWAWYCFSGFVFQALLYVIYQFCWSVVLEYVYMAFTLCNCLLLCRCTCRQNPLDDTATEEAPEDVVPEEPVRAAGGEKAFYSIVEDKLDTLCEGKMLFLEPDLTRETLCLRLSINRTYLSSYFRSRGTTFFQYINSLRIGYALKLMAEDPDMPVHQVSQMSGFKSQTTFRRVFQEELGCLPSEVRLGGQSITRLRNLRQSKNQTQN